MFKVKRVYDAAGTDDGYRVLVDRIWPRGMSKEKAHVGLWMKEIGPSDRLRKWFGHDPRRWVEFQKRYGEELRTNSQLFGELRGLRKKHKTITLVYSARDDQHNQAVAFRYILNNA
ncbi:MAG TPA: DUF488 family protein [Candidatus Acidoferrum sp.]|nr:DUF488 family protein [Candidatus Acidoferrum sp.]